MNLNNLMKEIFLSFLITFCSVLAIGQDQVKSKPGDTTLPSSKEDLRILSKGVQLNNGFKVADFFAKPKASSFQLSPDGKYMSYREKDGKNKNHIYVKHLQTGKVTRAIAEKDELIRGYEWANEKRLIYIMDNGGNENYHLFAANIDGSNNLDLTPYKGVQASILTLLRDDKQHMIISLNKNNPEVFEPYKLNINTGKLVQLYQNNDTSNPIDEYDFDKDGNLKGFYKMKDGINTEFYYKSSSDTTYKLLKSTAWYESFSVLRYDYATAYPDDAYIVTDLNSDKSELWLYDLKNDQPIRRLFSNPTYDVEGIRLSRHRKYELDYFSYQGEKPEIIPVSSYYTHMHQLLAKRFKDWHFTIADYTDDESKFLIFVYSDRLYGRYYSYEAKSGKVDLLYDLMPQLRPEKMAEMRPISFTNRDGVILLGYITLPSATLQGKRVPVIVNPHGGPQGERDEWGFNPESQLFAAAGYATLQINYRISGGYGKAFLKSGFKQIGRNCSNDLEDGVNYAIQKGWADPQKIAIYGGSYGGYATLMGLAKTPDIFACGVDYVGVSNLFTFMKSIPAYWKPYLKMLKEIWYDEDVPAEKEIMKQVSPVYQVDKIKKPLFVVQGANDPRVNINESDQIVKSLRSKNVDVPYLVKYDEGHGFGKEENRIELYTYMMGFFAKYLQ